MKAAEDLNPQTPADFTLLGFVKWHFLVDFPKLCFLDVILPLQKRSVSAFVVSNVCCEVGIDCAEYSVWLRECCSKCSFYWVLSGGEIDYHYLAVIVHVKNSIAVFFLRSSYNNNSVHPACTVHISLQVPSGNHLMLHFADYLNISFKTHFCFSI